MILFSKFECNLKIATQHGWCGLWLLATFRRLINSIYYYYLLFTFPTGNFVIDVRCEGSMKSRTVWFFSFDYKPLLPILAIPCLYLLFNLLGLHFCTCSLAHSHHRHSDGSHTRSHHTKHCSLLNWRKL